MNKWRALQLALLDPRLSSRSQVVFGRLLDHHNARTGLCCPSEETLAEALNCSQRSIRSAIRLLKELGYARVNRGHGIGGANKYILEIPTGKEMYERAEKERHKWRKELAAKPKNKPKKEPPHRKAAPPAKSNPYSKFAIESPSKVEKRSELESELVRRLGGGADAWGEAQNIEDGVIEDILGRYERGRVSLNKAIEILLLHVN